MNNKHQSSISYGPEFRVEGTSFRMRYVELATDGLRFVGYADDLAKRAIQHTGWFTDEYQEDKLRGVVYALPSRGGKPVYVSGYEGSYNEGCPCLDFSDLYDDKKDAAIDADIIAERCAKREREYREASSARCQYDELGDSIEREIALAKAIRRELRLAPRVEATRPTLYSIALDKVRMCFKVARQARDTREKLEDEYSRASGWRDAA